MNGETSTTVETMNFINAVLLCLSGILQIAIKAQEESGM